MAIRERISELDAEARDLLTAYTTRTERLDRILTLLTRAYCARCPRNAVHGCCDFADEAVREMPAEAVRVQEIECLANGGDLREKEGRCRYHTPRGCSLRLMKSSSCLGHLCDDLRAMLATRYAGEAGPFTAAMAKLVSGSLRREAASLLQAMDESIFFGEGLLARDAKPEGGE